MENIIKKIVKINGDKFPSELRLDLVSGDWVVIATGRARRPEDFKKEKRVIDRIPKKHCPFCHIETQETPILAFSQGKKVFSRQEGEEKKVPKDVFKKWTTIVIPNKYPAFIPYPKLNERIEGHLYKRINAVGHHELVITRDHSKQIAELSIDEIKELLDVFQLRYIALKKNNFVKYISIFQNHGAEAGASIAHPHSQIITTPLIDVDLSGALSNAKKYYKKHKRCIYCEMNKWEKKSRERIVFENKKFVAVCPFASKTAFQVIISPKKHLPYFEKITEAEKIELAEMFKVILNKIRRALGDPAYNLYLHTAPADGKNYDYYHWHWTIMPKTSIWAGFEIGARMEISTIEPETAATYLRKF